MTDILGYYQPIPDTIYGQPDGPPLEDLAAEQERILMINVNMFKGPGSGWVPKGSGWDGPSAPEWASQIGGPSNVPVTGWTVQNAAGSPAFGPYSTEGIGRIPDWTGNSGALQGGAPYDMTPVVDYGDFNPLNVGPIGDSVMQGWDGVPSNPNAPVMADGSLQQDLEY